MVPRRSRGAPPTCGIVCAQVRDRRPRAQRLARTLLDPRERASQARDVASDLEYPATGQSMVVVRTANLMGRRTWGGAPREWGQGEPGARIRGPSNGRHRPIAGAGEKIST